MDQPKNNSENDNTGEKLMHEEQKSEEDYKRMIISLEIQNQKYRNQLYELGEAVNKILDKTKLPKSNKLNTPNLEQQLELVKKQLHNVNQFIQIYQKEINSLAGKKKPEIQNLGSTEQLLKSKNQELNYLKRDVRELTHKNKALQYRLLEFIKKNRAKSFDQQALQLRELINENKNLKAKYQELGSMQEKRQVWLKNNIQSAKNLEIKIQSQEDRLPKIQLRKTDRSSTSLPKLQSQKKIYTKWLQSSREQSNSKLQNQLQDLEKINKIVQQKIKKTTSEIKQLDEQVLKLKEKVDNSDANLINQPVKEKVVKRKDVGCMVSKRIRKTRRDWIGKFDSLRFSDSRVVRQEARMFKVLFNTAGYFQFSYYAVKNPKLIFIGKLPFNPITITVNGKQSTFTVEQPDFIKNIRLKINLKNQKILEMHIVSNLGIQSEFITTDSIVPQHHNSNNKNQKKQSKPVLSPSPSPSPKEEQVEVNYEMDVKSNEAITSVFGSYGYKTDEKKNIVAVWLQGLGVQVIENIVEELI